MNAWSFKGITENFVECKVFLSLHLTKSKLLVHLIFAKRSLSSICLSSNRKLAVYASTSSPLGSFR